MGDDINTRETRFNFLRITNKDRLSQSESASDFVVGLKNNQAVQQTLELYIHSITFPNVFPNIGTHNNSLTFRARSLGGATNVQPTITIAPAFYSTAQLLVALKNAMDTAMIPVAGTIDFTQDPLTNLISFQTTNLDGVEFFSSLVTSTLAPYIGLTNDIVPYATSGTFDAIPNLAGEKVAYVHSKDIAPSQSELSNGLSVSSFCAVPIDVPYLGIQHYTPSTMETNKLIFNTQTDLTTLNIKLRATDGRILDVGDNQEIIIVFKVFH